MPLKLSVGLSKKVGLPDYGSLGASCSVEFELEHAVLEQGSERFHAQVRLAYAACSQAVLDELTRQQNAHHSGNAGKMRARPGYMNGRDANGRSATASQLRALQTIAARQKIDLASVIAERFHGARADELSITDASRLIDELKAEATGNGVRG